MRAVFLLGLCLLAAAPGEFTVERGWLAMPDGVRLSVTWFRPSGTGPWPVLLEMLPYRKDDSFYQRDYPLGAFFARNGYLVARVDVRGTGSSEGTLPDREYSDAELADAEAVIAQLAALPESNGNVGMYGISWSGFNAIMTAMRRPPALKAILAVDASDDLFRDDVHYLDGVYHVDRYELSIDHENALPDSLEYRLDEAWARDRFDREPWFLTYLRHQRDGEWWRDRSLRFHGGGLEVPTYLVGGLLDFYRDSVPRMFVAARGPVKAEIGPWNHAWPDNGEPGPNYEWRRNLVGWWDHWLKGAPLPQEPAFTVFVRDGHPPDASLRVTPGAWRHYAGWPIPHRLLTLFPTSGGALAAAPGTGEDSLAYAPGSGTGVFQWWGEATPDMAPDDRHALVYDSEPMREAVEVVGSPGVSMRVAAGAPLANWSVRLEDVHPDGRVSLVTGKAFSGAQQNSWRPLEPGSEFRLEGDLHFTTWTFRPGHRIRLAVTNAQFPMLWPTPYAMSTEVFHGPETRLTLPVPLGQALDRPLPPPEPRESRPDAADLPGGGWPEVFVAEHGRLDWDGQASYRIGDRRYRSRERTLYEVDDARPEAARFLGEAETDIDLPGRALRHRTRIEVVSDLRFFHVTFTRRMSENGRLVRERVWRESVPRDLH